MQAEIRYLPPHWRNGSTLDNVVGERLNAARTIAPQRIFAQTNLITQLGVYEGGLGGIIQPPAGVNGN